MGYQTKYQLLVIPGRQHEKIATAIASRVGGSPFDVEECRWYGHEQDVLAVSREHPDVLISIQGTGEGSDEGPSSDQWAKYFRDGEIEVYYRPAWPPKAAAKFYTGLRG